MIKKIICTLLFIVTMPQALAQDSGAEKEQLYVTDQLRLSLYQQADAQSGVLELLRSGDKLIIEEIAGPYALVTSPSGKKGWVKRGFLVSKRTSNLLLLDMTQSNELLKKELEKLADSKLVIDQYEADMDKMSAAMAQLEDEESAAQQIIADLKQEAEQKRAAEKARPALNQLIKVVQAYWHYIGLIALGFILLGFIIGKVLTETTVKKKFHGIKVW